MNRRDQSEQRNREERERIEGEIALLERRLTSLRLQLQVNERQREVQELENRQQRQAHRGQRTNNEEPTFAVGGRVQVTNRRDDLYGQEGVVTQISQRSYFIYFRLDDGTIRFCRPQNLVLIVEREQ